MNEDSVTDDEAMIVLEYIMLIMEEEGTLPKGTSLKISGVDRNSDITEVIPEEYLEAFSDKANTYLEANDNDGKKLHVIAVVYMREKALSKVLDEN